MSMASTSSLCYLFKKRTLFCICRCFASEPFFFYFLFHFFYFWLHFHSHQGQPCQCHMMNHCHHNLQQLLLGMIPSAVRTDLVMTLPFISREVNMRKESGKYLESSCSGLNQGQREDTKCFVITTTVVWLLNLPSGSGENVNAVCNRIHILIVVIQARKGHVWVRFEASVMSSSLGLKSKVLNWHTHLRLILSIVFEWLFCVSSFQSCLRLMTTTVNDRAQILFLGRRFKVTQSNMYLTEIKTWTTSLPLSKGGRVF